ncbi:MAG TPA: histidine kinase [Chryseolinea sp.]|nr:histidine kinase [Chryseolinea sp.]
MNAIENNTWRRVILTGIIVIAALLVRLIMFPDMRFFQHVLGSIALIVLVQIIWEIFNAIHKFLNKILPFSRRLYWRIAIQLAIGILIMLLFVFGLIVFLNGYIPFPITNVSKGMMIVSQVLMSLVINMMFIGDYFIRQWKEGILSAERFEKEKAEMKYHHLKNQVNPHFLFNALTSLDALIKSDPDLASRYVGHMAKVYRYVLEHKEREVVPLKIELEFIRHYLSLQNIRFGESLQIDTTMSEGVEEKGIVMVTLQLLIDNAIKHNEIHSQFPLNIQIFDKDNYLIVKNKKQIRKVMTSNKQGILQLIELYEYLSDRPVLVQDEVEYFIVKVPLL